MNWSSFSMTWSPFNTSPITPSNEEDAILKVENHAQLHLLRRVRGKAPMWGPIKNTITKKTIEKVSVNRDLDQKLHVLNKAKDKKNVLKRRAHSKNRLMSSNFP